MLAASGGTRKRHVLIVDDDGAAREAMGAALAGEFRVFLAPDLLTATRTLNREDVDLLILDVLLDGALIPRQHAN